MTKPTGDDRESEKVPAPSSEDGGGGSVLVGIAIAIGLLALIAFIRWSLGG